MGGSSPEVMFTSDAVEEARTVAHLLIGSADPEATRAIGRAIGGVLRGGDVVLLSGDLGMGKTVMAQGIGEALGVTEPVCSPTFALAHEYAGRVPVWHMDLYRLRHPGDAEDLGWEEIRASNGVLLVEWPERLAESWPTRHLLVRFRDGGDERRDIEIRAEGAWGDAILDAILRSQPAQAQAR